MDLEGGPHTEVPAEALVEALVEAPAQDLPTAEDQVAEAPAADLPAEGAAEDPLDPLAVDIPDLLEEEVPLAVDILDLLEEEVILVQDGLRGRPLLFLLGKEEL